MKPYATLLLFVSSLLSYSQDTTEILRQLDTCQTNTAIKNWAVQNSRAHLWEHPEFSHFVLTTALSRVNPKQDSLMYSKIIGEHAILHAIRMETDSNLYYIDKALAHTPHHDSTNIGYLYRNKGVAYNQKDQFNRAIEEQYNALRWLPHTDSVYRPLTYLELGKLLYKIDNNSLSISYCEKAIPYFEKMEDYHDLCACYNTIGLAMINSSPIDPRCIQMEHMSRRVAKIAGDTMNINNNNINLGIAHLQLGNLDSSAYYLHKAENTGYYFKHDRFVEQRLVIWANLLGLYLKKKDYEKAVYYADLVYPVAKENEFNFILEHVTASMVDLYAELGDMTRALNYSTEYATLVKENILMSNTELFNSMEREIQERIYRKELEIKEREASLQNIKLNNERNLLYTGVGILIILLLVMFQLYKLVVKQRKEASENAMYLNELNESKNRLFSIIGHDLRGPIGNSLFLLKEIPQRGDSLTPGSLTIHENIQQGLTEVHGLLENLLLWSRDQAKDLKVRKSDVDIHAIAMQCYNLMSVLESVRHMKLSMKVDPHLFWRLDAHAYSTILRNLISNALKYAPQNTEVNCTIYVEQDFLVTEICDRGKGIPDHLLKELNHKSETDNEKLGGMGLKLVQILVHQHGGTLSFEPLDNRFCIVFKIPR